MVESPDDISQETVSKDALIKRLTRDLEEANRRIVDLEKAVQEDPLTGLLNRRGSMSAAVTAPSAARQVFAEQGQRITRTSCRS